MEIGIIIKQLRTQKKMTQEEFASKLNISIQTVSRWENSVNCPDLLMLTLIAKFFDVTTDYLLGVERRTKNMKKLLKTVETFELETIKEGEEMVADFKASKFPILKSHNITEVNDKVILEVTKEFNADVNNMKFE